MPSFDTVLEPNLVEVRNAVDHGLEPPADREAAGKPPVGTIRLRAAEADGRVVIEIRDDGRGIDWNRVAQKARLLGLPWDQPEDLVAALFADGLSTKDSVSETSGRGVGLAAVRAACRELGGDVSVTSEPGKGSCFTMVLKSGVLRSSVAETIDRRG